VKRFLERFQLWRQERAIDFEDKFVARWLFLLVLFIGQDAYTLVATHQLPWTATLSTILVVAFFVLYIRRSRWAWVLLMLFAVVFIAGVPFAFYSASPRAPTGVRLFSAGFMLAFGAAAFVYSLVIRKRFARDGHTI
jgi:Na+-translocating ferredoxin:NAD+ oxidoreductase RnfD subunit